MRDPIRKYFSEKIQITFASSASISSDKPSPEKSFAKSGNPAPEKVKAFPKFEESKSKKKFEKPILTLKEQKEVRTKQWNWNRKMDGKRKVSVKILDKVITTHVEVGHGNDSLVEQGLKDQK